MPRYFKIGRKYDSYFRLINLYQSKFHCEVVLEVDDIDYLQRPKIADDCAKMIAKSFGIVKLVKKSEIFEHTTDKKVIVFDENNNVSEEYETKYYQIWYYDRTVRPKRRNKNNGKR